MSHFSEALDRLIEKRGIKASELAERIGHPANYISRYRSGTKPDPEIAVKIAEVFGEQDGLDLAAAFIKDTVPESFRNLVASCAYCNRKTSALENLAGSEREIFEELATLSQVDPKVATFLRDLRNFTVHMGGESHVDHFRPKTLGSRKPSHDQKRRVN